MSQDTCLCIDLRTAAQALTGIYDAAMAPAGISVTQFSQLNLIRILETPTLRALAEASQLDRSTLGRNVRVLEKLGLVAMAVGDDARTRTVKLTTKGNDAFMRAVPLWTAVQSQLLDRLGADGRDQLNQLLAALKTPLVTAA